MSNAPTLEEINASSPQAKLRTNYEGKSVKVSVVAAGGCGLNVLKSYLKTNKRFDEPVSIQAIDTSLSNVNGLDSNIEFHAISELGSGKDRSKNYNIIKEWIDVHPELHKEAADVTIIVASLAGGSGSIIQSLLTKKIMQNTDKAVLLIGVIDQSSERDCLNSINTLKSISNIAKENGFYIPIILFSNKLAGRFAVNKIIVTRINQTIDMLTNRSIEELDYNDKLSFMRPKNAAPGLYLFSITDKTETDCAGEVIVKLSPNMQVTAIMSVDDIGNGPSIMSSVSYFGYSEEVVYVSVTGLSIPSELLRDLKESQERYRDAVTAEDQTGDKLEITEKSNVNEIVL